MHLLLQILEEGKITDSLGRKIDFRNTIIIMTSNVGAELLKKQTVMGFGAPRDTQDYDSMRDKILEETKRVFKPEFLNRLDEIIVFHALGRPDLMRIVDLEVAKVKARIKMKEIDIVLDTAAHELGHILGIGTATQWKNLVSGDTFHGSNALLLGDDERAKRCDGRHERPQSKRYDTPKKRLQDAPRKLRPRGPRQRLEHRAAEVIRRRRRVDRDVGGMELGHRDAPLTKPPPAGRSSSAGSASTAMGFISPTPSLAHRA